MSGETVAGKGERPLTSAWLIRRPQPQPRMRLFCFPYAGGSVASFLPWQAAMGGEIEVCAIQLPGRGPRLSEPPIADFSALIATLTAVIGEHGEHPFAFFGHSLGGLVAFEVARACQMLGLPSPRHLFISGTAAPRWPISRRSLHQLDDDTLIEALRDYNGTPRAALENRELMELLLPAIRADFALRANYRYAPGPPLAVPISVLAGRQDPYVSSDSVADWRLETQTHCETHWFEGDHFFIHSAAAQVLGRLQATLLPWQIQNA